MWQAVWGQKKEIAKYLQIGYNKGNEKAERCYQHPRLGRPRLEVIIDNIPYGYCHCGCGEKTRLAERTQASRGWVKGQPIKYLAEHMGRAGLKAKSRRGLWRHPERFWEKVNKTDGCWEWTAHRNQYGYGTYAMQGRSVHAHRVAYELLRGAVPNSLQIDHLCRNRGCVNPEHMECVTPRENTLRGEGISAANARKTHCPQGHEFTEENTYVTPKQKRVCRECSRTVSLDWYYRNKSTLDAKV